LTLALVRRLGLNQETIVELIGVPKVTETHANWIDEGGQAEPRAKGC
jgi:hypothetical protein